MLRYFNFLGGVCRSGSSVTTEGRKLLVVLVPEPSQIEAIDTGVVGSAVPGLRAVPDLVPIHPILPPTVHIHL